MGDTWRNIMVSLDAYSAQRRKESSELTKEEVALRIRKYRIEHGNMSIESLAKILDVPRIQIYRWEQARNKPSRVMMDLLKERGIIA